MRRPSSGLTVVNTRAFLASSRSQATSVAGMAAGVWDRGQRAPEATTLVTSARSCVFLINALEETYSRRSRWASRSTRCDEPVALAHIITGLRALKLSDAAMAHVNGRQHLGWWIRLWIGRTRYLLAARHLSPAVTLDHLPAKPRKPPWPARMTLMPGPGSAFHPDDGLHRIVAAAPSPDIGCPRSE